MFERLRIQNFQSHDKTCVEFDPRITTIVGPSDVGKSAIIRALRWVCTNTPGGDEFVRYGTRGTTVRLDVDGHSITRRRGGDRNEYYLDDAKYVAFGRDVPEDIAALLNVGPVCWQRQHDAPYWFSNTPGEVSRELNAVVDLGIIDKTLANVASEVRRWRWRLDLAEEDLTKARTRASDLDYVGQLGDDLDALVELDTQAEDAATRAASLREWYLAEAKHHRTHERAAAAAQAGEVAVEAMEAHRDAVSTANGLATVLEMYREHEPKARAAVPDLTAMDAAFTAYREAVETKAYFYTLHNKALLAEEALCHQNDDLEKALSEMPKTCPVCGQSL